MIAAATRHLAKRTPTANKYKLIENVMPQGFDQELQPTPAVNFNRTIEQIKAEIAATFGFIPPFFSPAESPQVLENLWQQTLSAYVNNPLPALFKEKLSAYLSRFCEVPYCMICHSCTLRPLGLKAREVLELLEAPPPKQAEVDEHLKLLAAQRDAFTVWPESNSKLEQSLLTCAIFIALGQKQAEPYRQQMRRILGAVNYQHLVTFIAYVKSCHIWMEAHSEVAYEADKRVQEHLNALLEQEPDLAEFFRHYRERVKRECQSRAEQLAELAERQRQEKAWRQQAERERLVAEMAHRIRRSLNLEEILSTTVSEVRQFLQTERVFIYRFLADWSGFVAVESVASGWSSILGTTVKDSFFGQAACRELYKQGQLYAVEDVYTAGLSKCHQDLLARLQVRGNLVVPIVQEEQLWGLLVANQCSAPRHWQQVEIDLLKQLATQVGIAIQQSKLYQQVQTELSERQRSEAKIREQAALIDVATDAITVQALNQQIQFWNKGAERLYGWLAQEVLEKNINQLLYKESSSELQAALQIVIEQGEWQGELQQVTKSGKEIVVNSRWTLVLDEAGQPKSILVVNTDVTEKKQLEAQFLRAQRLESIGTLASGIAHDLNNVLTPILASAQLLQAKINEEKKQRLLTTIEASTKRGAALVKQVLSFTRGIEGKPTILQVRHLLGEIQHIAVETFPKSIELCMDVSSDLWTVSADPTQLHQVLMNLVVNARDAMPKGGTLILKAENFIVDQTYARMHVGASIGPYIVITVSDTGTGMPPEILDRIFEPFFTTKELGKGTGLGLSTVMGIIKNHGGFVDVSSEIEQGTQFKVFLPVVEGAQAQLAEDFDLPSGRGELILVVDDEGTICEITKTSLETYNYKVITASNGLEAIALYARYKHQISAVLLDMMMPELDGLTTSRILHKLNPLVLVIGVSGLANSAQATAARDVGIQSFLSKPYTTQELLKTLSALLNVKSVSN